MSDAPFKRLTIIGLGLIGGSFAMAARERYPDLWIQGVDVNEESLQYAVRHKIIDKASLFLPEQWEEEHLIVLAAHLSDNLALLKTLAPLVRGKNILVTDIGSCKRAIVALGQELLPTQFIGGHPMAGKEFSGIAHATALLFAGKAFLLCPHAQTDEAMFERLKTFVNGLGAVARSVDPVRHDRYMAYVSHLPQLYAIMLTNLLYQNEPGHLLSFHGGGLDDQLRLAASPYTMWRDVFAQNKDNMQAVLQELGGLMQEASGVLDQPDFAAWFERSNTVHKEFNAFRHHRADY